MKIAQRIDVKTDTTPASGNVIPLLFEIRHKIARWLENGEQSVIDLLRIPLAQGEDELIEAALGEGEVHAQLKALGKSVIVETTISGAWLVTHYNSEDEIMGKYVEVTDMPEILKSPPDDVRRGLVKLDEYLAKVAKLQ